MGEKIVTAMLIYIALNWCNQNIKHIIKPEHNYMATKGTNQICFRTFEVDLGVSIYPCRPIALEGTISSGPNLVPRNIFINVR